MTTTTKTPKAIGAYTYDRTSDLAKALRIAGYDVLADALRARHNNIRHFAPEGTAEKVLIDADLRLIDEMERMLDALGITKPRYRPGAAAAFREVRA